MTTTHDPATATLLSSLGALLIGTAMGTSGSIDVPVRSLGARIEALAPAAGVKTAATAAGARLTGRACGMDDLAGLRLVPVDRRGCVNRHAAPARTAASA